MSPPWFPSALPAPVIPHSRDPANTTNSPFPARDFLRRTLPRSSASISSHPATHPGIHSCLHPSQHSQPFTPAQQPGIILLFLFCSQFGRILFSFIPLLNAFGEPFLCVLVLLAWVCPQVHSSNPRHNNTSAIAI